MSESFKVHRIWMEHEGGTKFYQLFLIESHSLGGVIPAGASVTHYGPMSSRGAKGDKRPVNGGKVSILSPMDFISKFKQKEAKGYKKKSEEFTNPCSKEKLIAWFGAQETDAIYMVMFGTTTPDFTAEPEPTEDTDTKDLMVAKAPDVRPASWGSW